MQKTSLKSFITYFKTVHNFYLLFYFIFLICNNYNDYTRIFFLFFFNIVINEYIQNTKNGKVNKKIASNKRLLLLAIFIYIYTQIIILSDVK